MGGDDSFFFRSMMKSQWNANSVECLNCSQAMKPIAEQDGSHILWCEACGTLLVADEFDSLADSDFKLPKTLFKNEEQK